MSRTRRRVRALTASLLMASGMLVASAGAAHADAIAIPVFLSQRAKAQDTSSPSP